MAERRSTVIQRCKTLSDTDADVFNNAQRRAKIIEE